MRKLTFLLLISLPFMASAQTGDQGTAGTTTEAEKKTVVQTVQQFFSMMETHDTSAAKNIVLTDCQLYSVQKTNGSINLQMRRFTDFIQIIGQRQRLLVEKIWDPTIMVHGEVAIVWAPYDFHLNGQLTHCGVDVFNLVKTNTGWRISGVQYTVEPDACAVLQKK